MVPIKRVVLEAGLTVYSIDTFSNDKIYYAR